MTEQTSVDIPPRYSPHSIEDAWFSYWEKNNLFAARPNPSKKPFCIVIPPPNVTGILHMGHALNNTIQDILIRYHRMKGEESLWMPGTDHAGIATQNVVEKALAKEGLKRHDVGREKFVERVWQWKEQYGSTIIKQLKKLGASCDWSRLRFTMDAEYSRTVIEVFVRLYEQGLIYQGNYIINWCPRCQTALSDEEAPHHEVQGNLYYLRYPLKADPEKYIVVATTRPETMLGDTAVAVHPRDKRYKKLIGATLILPLMQRPIKVIADDSVDMKFGTGAVKVTPAHDPNDYTMGKNHKLEFINCLHPDGRMNEFAGDYRDMDRFEAREVILQDLREKGLLEKIEPHQLSAGHCYRCHTIIEPYLSKQWFVKMKPLAKAAIEVVKRGKIKFYPKRWTKVYLNWMENIQDWCISRQIWWGHRLPVYYCRNCQSTEQQAHSEKLRPGVIVSRVKPEQCPYCSSTEIYQDEDVLDTWFSSWLWPFAVFYWQSQESGNTPHPTAQKDLAYFYPTSVLVTAPEIIFFWVARMIMAGLAFMKDVPFRDVYIHGTVRDVEGKKMSKSLGNIIDPLEIIKEYGTDALRFSLISITAQGQDVYLSKERFEQGRNFANKIWNASRFILLNLDQSQVKTDLCRFFAREDLGSVNRWILSRFYSVLSEVTRLLEAYKFNEAANLLYSFFWHEFCDWYVELIKSDTNQAQNQVVMYKVLEKFLRCLHPFMPFITEELWQRINPQSGSIMIQPWPHVQEDIIDKRIEARMADFFQVVTTIRNMRAELEVPLQNTIRVKVAIGNKGKRDFIASMTSFIKRLAKVEELEFLESYRHARGEYVTVIQDMHCIVPLEGVVDTDKYLAHLKERIEKVTGEIQAKTGMLSNQQFLKRAPEEVVAKEKEKLENLKDTLSKLKVVQDAIR
jgi:valyl-tRNA synthetase